MWNRLIGKLGLKGSDGHVVEYLAQGETNWVVYFISVFSLVHGEVILTPNTLYICQDSANNQTHNRIQCVCCQWILLFLSVTVMDYGFF